MLQSGQRLARVDQIYRPGPWNSESVRWPLIPGESVLVVGEERITILRHSRTPA